MSTDNTSNKSATAAAPSTGVAKPKFTEADLAAQKRAEDRAAKRAAAVRNEAQRAEAPRERSQTHLGGLRLKMSVIGRIPGFHLYWENDDEGAIEQLLFEGFQFVEPSEVRMQSHIVADTDTANRVSRYVGKKADGSPMRAYLLKCSDALWAEREQARYDAADNWDNAIRENRVQADNGRYIPKGVNSEVDTSYRKDY